MMIRSRVSSIVVPALSVRIALGLCLRGTLHTRKRSITAQIARSTLRRRRFKCHDVRLDDTLDDT